MRRIVHLSDLHFGRVNPVLIDPLIRIIREVEPDLVAVSGDLTQRARSYQFQQARSFLDALPKPQIVVPGNHDIPLHNLFARFVERLTKYKRYITDDLQPVYEDEELVIIGVNTARSSVFKGGRINISQVSRLREKFCSLGSGIVKVVVTHHPFDLPEGHTERDLVGRAKMAMTELAECGADLFLAGHLHISHTGHTKRYNIRGHSALVVQAGTATSTRERGEANSFNLVRIAYPEIIVEKFAWDALSASFAVSTTEQFKHTNEGWIRMPMPQKSDE
ncbi:MAG TPA: metallophosphoesterase family protein [Pyrinomonadaceae bacterium]|nr:metallophosphoesterase family protein [Pyrinomonadaceae bacterium]